MRLLIIVCVIVALLSLTECAKILGIFHMAAYSHFQLGDKLFKGLAARGHEVTVISPYAPKKETKNMKYVVTTGEIERMDAFKGDRLFKMSQQSVIQTLFFEESMGKTLSESTLNHTNVKEFLRKDHQFDMVIMEEFMNNAFAGFCHHYQAHCVFVATFGVSRWTNSKMGNPGSPSYQPEVFLAYPTIMNFYQRTVNAVMYVVSELIGLFMGYPIQNSLLQTYFPGAPPLKELYNNVSLMLLNSHVSTNSPAPLVPNMIEIGGYHINDPKPLPKDLQDFLDNAKDGAIYFSLGSNLKSKDMPAEKRDAILKSFGKLKHQVLWKWEDENLPGQPSNVKLSKWLPQQDILAHPNVKLFITHGGLLSTIETVYHGKPVIGIPVFGDQFTNMYKAEHSGYGISVPFPELTEEKLTSALNKILKDPKYAENVKTRFKIMHDQPMKPIDKAMFWLEYVLRHNGAHHLRTAAVNLSWYQYLLLDVVAVVVFVSLLSLYLVCKVFKIIFCKKSNKVVAKNKKRD